MSRSHAIHAAVAACILFSSLAVASCGRPFSQSTSSASPQATWKTFTIPTLAQGARAAAFDSSRDSIWILTDALGANRGHSVVSLAEFNVKNQIATPTAFSMNGDDYLVGQVAIDASHDVWVGWGHTLARYKPESQSVDTWPMPTSPRAARPPLTVSDGRLVSMSIATDGEVWTASLNVAGLVGFNPGTKRWDRQVDLPIFADMTSRIIERTAGHMLINGRADQTTSTQKLLDVNVGTGVSTDLQMAARDYAISANGEMVYVDRSNAAMKSSPSIGSVAGLATRLPIANSPNLTPDSRNRVWYNMLGYRSVGIGSIDVVTGAVALFPFPYIDHPGVPLPSVTPCKVQVGCISSDSVFDPDVQALVVDGQDDVWVLTRVSGAISSLSSPSGVYEMLGGA